VLVVFFYFLFCFFYYNYFVYLEERDEEFYIFFSILFFFIFLNSFERDSYFLYFLFREIFLYEMAAFSSLLQRKEVRTCWKIFIGKNLGKLSFGIVRLELHKKF